MRSLLEALDKIATEKRLRELGMGYRAVFIKESARELNQPMEITIRKYIILIQIIAVVIVVVKKMGNYPIKI